MSLNERDMVRVASWQGNILLREYADVGVEMDLVFICNPSLSYCIAKKLWLGTSLMLQLAGKAKVDATRLPYLMQQSTTLGNLVWHCATNLQSQRIGPQVAACWPGKSVTKDILNRVMLWFCNVAQIQSPQASLHNRDLNGLHE
jgi:hypothetical protein